LFGMRFAIFQKNAINNLKQFLFVDGFVV